MERINLNVIRGESFTQEFDIGEDLEDCEVSMWIKETANHPTYIAVTVETFEESSVVKITIPNTGLLVRPQYVYDIRIKREDETVFFSHGGFVTVRPSVTGEVI